MSDLQQELANVVGESRIMQREEIAQRATSHWNSAPMQGASLLMPSTTGEIARLLNACNAAGQNVITQGGVTNCVKAAEPTSNDVILSTEKMTGVIDIDRIGGTATVEAGVKLQSLQEAVLHESLYFPLDLGARGSCTVGGNVATNAGGINVLRYGMMRNLVLGLETVLADGTVVSSLNRMIKNNAGYDTKQLFIGSEGTLGIVTRAVLRLFPEPQSRQNALAACRDFASVANLLAMLQRDLAGTLSAFEIMWNDHYSAVTAEGRLRAPLSRDYPFYVIFQAEGGDAANDEARFERVLTAALEAGLIIDAVLPKSESEVGDIWATRETFEALTEVEPYYLYDVSLPIRDMDAYVIEVRAAVEKAWPGGRIFTLGHVADGNLHFFIVPGVTGDHHHLSNRCVYEPLAQYGGSVSAEHGIGVDKIGWLPYSRSSADIALMKTLKTSLDPNNILNPGRVLGDV